MVEGLDETLIDLRDPADDRVQAWIAVANEFARLDRPLPYVGTFGAVLRSAAAHARALPPEQQRIAAAAVVNTTATKATRIGEFRQGMEAAAMLDPDVLDPRTVIARVLRPALSGVEEPRRRAVVSFAATLVFERIGDVDLRRLAADDLATLFEAAKVVAAVAETLRELSQRLPRTDRKRMLSMLPIS